MAKGKAMHLRTRWSDPFFKRSQNLKLQAKPESKRVGINKKPWFPCLVGKREICDRSEGRALPCSMTSSLLRCRPPPPALPVITEQ